MRRMLWLLLLTAGAAFSAARAPAPGHYQLFSGLTRYQARNIFEHDGDRRRFPQNGRFDKLEADASLLYGHDEDWSFIGGLAAGQVRYRNSNTSDTATVLSEVRAGARRRLLESGDHLLAGQLMVFQPGWGESTRPQPGVRQTAVEARALWDWSLWSTLEGAFFTLETAYRSYTGTAPDQTRVEPTFMWRKGAWLPMFQWTWIRALRDGARPNTDDIFASRAYELHKATAALAYQCAPDHHVQLGYSRDVAGRDVGGGQALALNWWWQP